MTFTLETIDLAAIKRGQQAMWASGDFGVIASLIHLVAERLADSADLIAGWRLLDVAGGTGNAAIAAARCGCQVTCTDYVPALLEHGRERARAEPLDITFVEADAEALPCEDGEYDAVLSEFGSMFAPNQPRRASPSCWATRSARSTPAGARARGDSGTHSSSSPPSATTTARP
jgi:SAM-dependent methyltransferase